VMPVEKKKKKNVNDDNLISKGKPNIMIKYKKIFI